MDKKAVIALIFVAVIFLFASLGCTKTKETNTNGSEVIMDGNNSKDNNAQVYNNLEQLKKVKNGDTVSVHYVGKLTDGAIFDSSVGKDPLSFVVGAHQMISGFEEGVIGMKVGEKKTITLAPEQAYGLVDPKKIITFDKNSFNDFNLLKTGMVLTTSTGARGTVSEKTDLNFTVNFNHELAGKTLVFDLILVSIN
jgi:FKBP-type peptidyl-prolyl cis-trans isomerase 2